MVSACRSASFTVAIPGVCLTLWLSDNPQGGEVDQGAISEAGIDALATHCHLQPVRHLEPP